MLLDEGARYRRYRRRHHLFGVGAGCEGAEIGRDDKVDGKYGSGSATSWSGPLPHQEARCDEGVDVHDSTSEMTASCRIVDSTTAIIPRDENRQPYCGSGDGSGDGLWARLSACFRPFESSGCGRCHDVLDGNSSEEHADDAIVAKSTALPPATTAELHRPCSIFLSMVLSITASIDHRRPGVTPLLGIAALGTNGMDINRWPWHLGRER